ncbi:MAG: class I SAM-dependent methyltransferase [Candidatus Micrarchaeota archaeon]
MQDIKHSDLVLEVGSGHNPHMRSDVLLDLFEEDTPEQHRGGTKATVDRPFVKADICNMPFKDKVFDYVIAIHILEHIPNIKKAISEITRVGKRGYIIVPSELNEYLHPSDTHMWFCSRDRGRLVFKKKPKNWRSPFGNLFHYLWNNDQEYFRFYQHHLGIYHLHFPWKGEIKSRVEKYSLPSMEKWGVKSIARPTGRGIIRDLCPHWLQVRIGKSDIYPKLKTMIGKPYRRRKIVLDNLLK